MHYQGFVHPGFAAVATEFVHQIPEDGRSGAALAVYLRGEPVLDIWAGRRDHAGNPWLEDTLALSFSTTKGVASLMMHVLVDRGLIEYDKPVSYYWPEFREAGKADITIYHLLCHQAGLYDIRGMIEDASNMLDWQYMIRRLEQASPKHRPGTAHGYHALTYGWLLGEVMSRVTGKSFAELLQQLLVIPLHLDGLYVGLPEEQMGRRALLAGMPARSAEAAADGDLESGQRGSRRRSMAQRVQAGAMGAAFRLLGVNPRDITAGLAPRGISRFSFNDPEVVRSSIPAANGMFTARSLARIYGAIAEGGELDGVRILSAARVREMARIQSRSIDRVVPLPMHWRLGFHRVFTTGPRTPQAFGHFGWGGSGAWCDPSRHLAVGFIVNSSGGTSPFGDTRIARLNAGIIRCAERVEGLRGPFRNVLSERFHDLRGRG